MGARARAALAVVVFGLLGYALFQRESSPPKPVCPVTAGGEIFAVLDFSSTFSLDPPPKGSSGA